MTGSVMFHALKSFQFIIDIERMNKLPHDSFSCGNDEAGRGDIQR